MLFERADRTARSIDPDAAGALAQARRVLKVRRRREDAFPEVDFGEPCWDILLELYVASVTGRAMHVTSLCIASAVPYTTAMRWIGLMTKRGQIIRSADPYDKRKSCLSIAPDMALRMTTFLSAAMS